MKNITQIFLLRNTLITIQFDDEQGMRCIFVKKIFRQNNDFKM